MTAATPDPDTLAPRPGRRLGRYELCAELARGGMASVFLGRAHGLAGFEKLVAVKCIHSRYARDRGFIEMFLDEARIASRITHPNVGSVFDVGEDAGVYYLAMDYLHGESLASTMRALAAHPEHQGPRWQALAVAIAADVAEGLHAAHELRGAGGELLEVVHRDVSPQNVFIGYDGTVRVVDFGIARAAGRLHKTLSGVVKGKVAYMAPEQLRSEEVDRRADVWALGVVLWEMLTCQRLFRRDNEGKQIRAVLEDPIRPPGATRELDAIVLRALSREPSGRWQTARDLGRELRRYLAAQREVVSGAELSEWMEELFASERKAKEALIEQTRAGAVPDTERMDRAPADAVATEVPDAATEAHSGVRRGRTTEREYPAMPAPPPLADPLPAPASDAKPAQATTAPRWRTESVVLPVRPRRLLWIAAALVLSAAALVLVVSRREDPPPAPDLREAPTAPAREPPAPAPPVTMATLPPTDPPDTARVAKGTVPNATKRERPRRRVAKGTVPHATPGEPGRVIVGVTEGWGTISVDGRPAGQAPRAIELLPGEHVIEVMPFGEPPVRREVVRVAPGGTHRVVVDP